MKSVLALMLMAGAAWAEPVFDIGATELCLEEQGHDGDRTQCIGVSAGSCMDQDNSTYGMNYCLEQEWMWWDDQLNAAYQIAKENAAALDADAEPPLNVQVATLRDMQRAWITFRDARCNWEAAQWQGGTGAGPALLGCLMDETGRQAITLQVLGLGD